jgi:hypothetical protein
MASAPGAPDRASGTSKNRREIIDFVSRHAKPLKQAKIMTEVKAHDLLGRHTRSKIGAVAAAIVRDGVVVIVDGVDLGVLTPTRGLSTTNHVVHTFWQYRRVAEQNPSLVDVQIKRVGVVLNGAKTKNDAYYDAHDYAMEQFRKEADLAIDGESIDDQRTFEDFVGA